MGDIGVRHNEAPLWQSYKLQCLSCETTLYRAASSIRAALMSECRRCGSRALIEGEK